MTQEQKDKIRQVLEANNFAVIATNSASGYPESAVITISITEDMNIIFGSFVNSRKNQNIKRDSRVSMVIGWDSKEKKTLQIEGNAKLLEGDDRKMYEDIHCKKNPGSEKYRNNSLQEYFIVKPFWVRYSYLSLSPAEVWEVKNDL